jgi:predicted enzyme related to lactoylglutathione lyase
MSGMPLRTSPWPAGVPCWVDLTVTDVPLAQAFYGAVLGWTFTTTGAEFGGYVLGQSQGMAAAGIGPTPAAGLPAAWTLYFAADDADATAKLVTDAGGTLLLPPGDVGPLGRMFVAADPTGAVFGVWQAGTHIGAGVHSEPGGLIWEDLRSPDPDRARAFYAGVFGYDMHTLEGAGPEYTTFHRPGDEAPMGGIGGMFGQDAPPYWLVYFGVADTDLAVEQALGHGGSTPAAPADTSFGRVGMITDPFGATFMVVQTDGTTPPPER